MNSIGYIFGGANVINGSKFDNNVVLTPLQKLKGELHQLIIAKNYDGSVALDENDRGITLHITDEILFPSGKAELSEDSKDVLGNLADILKKIPNDIRVEGHTDNIPIQSDLYPSNWHLSVARALNTAYFLINDKGLNPDKVSIVGYSEYQPIAPNESKIGRSKNRRVDIVIIK